MSEILIILLLTLINALFAMSEIAIISSRRIRLQKPADKGHLGAKAALELAAEPNRFLATVQFGITLISILNGVYGGNSIAAKLKPVLEAIPSVQPYAESLSFLIVVVLITFISLIFGELIPKRIGMSNPEGIAMVMAPAMKMIAKIGSPFVWLLSQTTELFLRIFGLNKVKEQSVTEEEINAMIEEGMHGGQFEIAEQKIVEQVFKMADKHVDELMTPRMDIVWLDVNETIKENTAVLKENLFNYYPVCEDSLDTILGIVRLKDILTYQLDHEGKFPDLRQIVHEPFFVPENMRAFRLLEMMKEEKTHFALVIDEFGTLQGSVTMNDVLQGIAVTTQEDIEEMEDEKITRREDGSFLIDGLLSKDYFKDYFHLDELPNENEYNTIAGFVISGMKGIPETGEKYQWHDFNFEVVDMDGNRIDKLIVSKKKG